MATRLDGRVAVALFAVCCCAAGLTVRARDSTVGPPAPDAPSRRAAAPRSDGALPAAGSVGEDADERDAVAAAPMLTVCVVDAGSGRALSEAEVWTLAPPRPAAAAAAPRWFPAAAAEDPDPPPGVRGTLTDREGIARLPWPAGPALVLARRSGLRGVCAVPADPSTVGPLRIALLPHRCIEVVALDESGHAAGGVPIALRLGSAAAGTVPLGVTAAAGSLRVDLARWLATGAPVELGADVPGVPWNGVVAEPGTDVVFVPAGQRGELEVRLLRADGSPAAAGLVVQVGTRNPDRGVGAFLRTCHVVETDRLGIATFPTVGGEQRLFVRAASPGQVAVCTVEPSIAGVRRREVRCVLPEPRWWLQGQALDARGHAVIGERLLLAYRIGDAPGPRSAVAETDGGGNFAFALADADGATLRASLTRMVGGRLSAAGASLPLRALPAGGVVHVGSLRLVAAPELARGRIVGARGDLVLRVECRGGAAAGGRMWVDRLGGDRFVVRGEAPSPDLLLWATLDGMPAGPPLPFAVGDRTLELRLQRPAEVRPVLRLGRPGGPVRISTRAAR